MPDIEIDMDMPHGKCKAITVFKISKFLFEFGVILDDYSFFYDHLELPRKDFTKLKNKEGYDQIKSTMEKWVLTKGSKAIVGTLHDAFDKMGQIDVCEQLLKFADNQRERVIIIEESKLEPTAETSLIQTEINTSVGQEDKKNNNQAPSGMMKLPSIAIKIPPETIGHCSSCDAKSKKRFSWRMIVILAILAIFFHALIVVGYFTIPGILQSFRSDEDPKIAYSPREFYSRGQGGQILQLDTTLKPKLVVEDGIMTFIMNSGQYCKKQPRRRIKLWLSELKLFNESLLFQNNATHCLQNIEKLNITGPLEPAVLTKVMDYSPNLGHLVFYKMEPFCFSENYLSHSSDQKETNSQKPSSVVKLVFDGFGKNCLKGVSILTSVVDTSNLASIEVLNCDFEDGEVTAITKLVDRSPRLMDFSCCGVKCSKFKLYDWIVFMVNEDCIIFKRE